MALSESTPRILYQTWKTHTLPDNFKKNQQAWIDAIRSSSGKDGWRYVLLDDTDLRNLVKDNFPQHLEKYDSFTKNIERVDFARCVMMWLGGVYADLDTYPGDKGIDGIDELVDMNKIILGCEPREHAKKLYNNRDIVLCNAFMISPPRLTTWPALMDYIMDNYEHYYRPVDNTGPMALTRFFEKNPKLFEDAVIYDACAFFPLTGSGKITQGCVLKKGDRENEPVSTSSSEAPRYNPTGRLSTRPTGNYVVHEWQNTWCPEGWWNDDMIWNRRYWFWALLTLFVVGWLYVYNTSVI